MLATVDAANAMIFLSAIGLLAVVVAALAAYVATGRSEGRAARPGLALLGIRGPAAVEFLKTK
jgi:hypothetical protein